MPQFTFTFDLPPGIASNDTTFASRGRWASGSNVRFDEVSGRAQVIGGWTTSGTVTGGVINSLFFHNYGPGQSLYAATISDAFVASATATFGGTNFALAGVSANYWTFGPWGSTLLMVPTGETLYAFNAAASPWVAPVEVAAAPDRIVCMLVTQQRQVIAFGCNEVVSGTYNGRCIRGSDLEDYTNWTPATSNNSFEDILSGASDIMAAREVGAYIGVWTGSGLHLGYFKGNPDQTYHWEAVAEGVGLMSDRSLCVFEGIAYWLCSDGRFMSWVPGDLPKPIPCPISRDFLNNMNLDHFHLIHTFANTKFGEIWCWYGDTRTTGSNSRYVAFNVRTGAWFQGILQRGAVLHNVSVDGAGGFLAAQGGSLFVHESGNTAAGSALNWSLQSADQYLDGDRLRVMAQSVEPDFEDQVGDVSLTLFVRDRPQSSATTKGPYTLTTATKKQDFRASGRIMAIKLSGGAASGSFMRLGKLPFDCVTMGAR